MSKSNHPNWPEILKSLNKTGDYKHLHWEGSFSEYLSMVNENPAIARNSFQRMYDMIISYGHD